jgi:hypothetical protein
MDMDRELNNQIGDTPPKLLLRGLDSLYVGNYVRFDEGRFDWSELLARKELLRENRRELEEIQLGSKSWGLMPYGKNPYAIVLVSKTMEVRLGRRIIPNCYVQFYSEGLWTRGLPALTAEFLEWVNSLGGKILRPESVSRADWAFDYCLSEIDFTDRDFVTRADKTATWSQHQQLQTVQLGKGHIVVRVYDKIAEIKQQSSKHFFFDLWGQKDNVWRTEFQVRRERLKSAGINTINDIGDLQGDLLHTLANDHTRLCRPGPDQNRARWPLHPLWEAVVRDVKTIPRFGLVADLPPNAGLQERLFRQMQSIYGDLKGVGALIQLINNEPEPPFLFDTLRDLHDLIEPHHSQAAWNQALSERVQKWRCGQW